MKKFLAIAAVTTAILTILCILTVPAYAGEVDTAPVTEAVTEVVTETPITEAVTEAMTEAETETETETTVPFDQWLYGLMQEATPEQMEMIEKIVLGGVGALDKLGIKGFDRIRVWVEYNMATVMVIALIVGLVAFCVVTVLQKTAFAKKADILNSNAIEMYDAGQAQAEEAHAACKAYADRSDAICHECADAAKAAAEEAKAAHGQVSEERALLIAELDKTAKVNAAMCETIYFLLQCSDLSQAKREEAEAIFKKGMEAMNHDHTDEV